jgi:hypothetical protein
VAAPAESRGCSASGAASSAAAAPAAFGAAAGAFASAAEQVLAAGDYSAVDSSDLERVLSAAVKLYAVKTEAGTPGAAAAPPVSAARVTPTEVVVAVSEMLRAVDVSVFDLAMWYRRGGA